MRICGMRPGISITLSAADRRRLQAIIRNRNALQKHVWRAEIVLFSADGLGTVEIMRRTGKADGASPKGEGEGEPTSALRRRQPLTPRGGAASRPLPAGGER